MNVDTTIKKRNQFKDILHSSLSSLLDFNVHSSISNMLAIKENFYTFLKTEKFANNVINY